ncbi:DUF2489 domain-containing protein [Aestuariirhabdus litorea]|uniref:DUF2489 domain-containing protein n=1 Tax=Aestuariirhabdus litorea TaxID=2528527 RepID=A0A3P3VQ26_9GAMM|nr:DUF2489 domain-containing protein [Aestuariirhabdus litorea]RRJ84048.1 DUF2489 domain-containing protein [Aestuariirhabdus litorea]RWW97268.1 DUF2489 domain-containing protein [Endozoicomonadaceae bacterium GTF-13]
MSESATELFVLLGTLVIIGLSIYACYLWRQVYLNTRRIRELQQQQRQQLMEAIQIISLSMERQELNPTEGCIRLKVLLEKLDPELLQSPEYRVIEQIYERSRGFATHQARRALPSQERRHQDEAREALEAELKQEVHNAVLALRGLATAYRGVKDREAKSAAHEPS